MQEYLQQRWEALSIETKRFLLNYDPQLSFMSLLWQKQYYQELANARQ